MVAAMADFGVLAETSVTLLGLSGLTTVIGRSKFDERGAQYRVLLLLYTSSAAFVASMLPLIGVPILFAAGSLTVLATLMFAWGGVYWWPGSRRRVVLNPFLIWTFVSLSILLLVVMWWATLTQSEHLQYVYQLAIGFLLLTATTVFVRLVRSVFSI
jgi:lysylphosphatidylglycerol synthetase-like protein (DUF2156 family)